MKSSESELPAEEYLEGPALDRVIPISEVQSEVWLADRLGPEASLAFNESVNLRLSGPLDVASLRAALDALTARHESLRSTLSPDGSELLVGTPAPIDLMMFDLRALEADHREAALERARAEAVSTPFDLERGPLFRAALYRLGKSDFLLMMTAHHIVCDGWSWGVITRDLGALYAEQIGEAPGLDEAERYSDYVVWAAGEAAGPAMNAHEAFWLGRFAGSATPVLELPTNRPRGPLRSFNSRRIDRMIPAELIAPLRAMGAKTGASLFATVFSGFALLLHRVTRHDEVVIGVPAAGQSASGMKRLVGHCVNLLPIPVALDPEQPFDAFLRQTSAHLMDAFEHQTMTYGTLLKKLPVHRDPSRLPLVSVMFNLDQAIHRSADLFPGLQMEFSSNPRRFENFELFLNAVQVEGGLRLECQYNTDLFDDISIGRWLESYEALLESVTREPSVAIHRIACLAPSQRTALQTLQPAASEFPGTDLMHSGFVQQALATPTRPAVSHDGTTLTYEQLDGRSNMLAHFLRARGVGRGSRVGICLGRSADMVAAVLAVLKAGGTYIPLDPGFPQARLNYYAEDAQLTQLITESASAHAPRAWRSDAGSRVIEIDTDLSWTADSAQPLASSDRDATPEDAAYIIYTSGSTGKPKGVCVPHRSVVNFLVSMRSSPGITAADRLAAVTTLSFDIAVLELMLPLIVGAEVVIVPRETAMDGNELRRLLESSHTTLMQATPGMWRNLIEAGWHGTPRFKALVGGESLPSDLACALLDRTGELWNMYGPTETTVWSTIWKVDRAALARRGMSIGQPIANTSVWVLGPDRQPCAVGIPGEICIGGSGVALGYLDRPELTADRFIADHLSGVPGAMLYRTGDLGRWRNDGLLEHLGRLDFQVKVRGYRIELAEIEALSDERPDVVQSVVLAREDRPGDVRLVAYLVRNTATEFDEAGWRSHLASRLPDYMLPQHCVVLDALPLLPNGKIDRKALPAPDLSQLAAASKRVAPRNDLERAVLAAMEAVLSLPGLGVRDDFFALGGHSLLAARLTSRLNRDFEVTLPLRTLFEARTTERMALALGKALASGSDKRQPICHDPSRTSAPLTPMQERIRFVEELHPGRVVYNTPSGHRLRGPMDVASFEAALRTVVGRQPSLRTFIRRRSDGEGYEQAVADTLDFPFPIEDLTTIPEAERETELLRRMQSVVDTPIDIYQGPLFRAGLFKLGPDHHAFLFMPHHIVWDGWSFDLLYEDMATAYGALEAGRPAAQAPLPVTYGDFAQWHSEWMQGPECARQLQYWVDRFAKTTEPKALRPDNPRRAGMSGEGASEWVRVDKGLTERLRTMAISADATLNMLTMAVYSAMMASVADSPSIVIGVPVRGRPMAELESIMGFFNNLLPLQIEVDRNQSVVDFIRHIKQELLEAFSHQEIPFERLAEEPAVAARAQRTGLYQALFSFQDARDRTRQWGQLSQSSILLFQKGATEDLGLWLMEVPNGLEGGFTYNADLYTSQTASAFRERYLELLARVASNPELTLNQLLHMSNSASAEHLVQLKSDNDGSASPAKSVAARRNAETVLPPAEAAIAELWASLLTLDPRQLRSRDTFASIGGTRAQAEIASAQTESALGFRLEADRYMGQTLAQLAHVASLLSAAAPTTSPAERTMIEIWAKVLDIEASQISTEDNFFDLGGNSLLAMRAIDHAARALGFRVDARRYFSESLAQLAVAEVSTPSTPEPVGAMGSADSSPRTGLFSRVLAGFGRKHSSQDSSRR